ncbi:MAG: hypothetical protein MJ157_04370 [Clostridia bacterium]|nr:hypothetical protein [Clostridia bacterium]
MSTYEEELQALQKWYEQECALVREMYMPEDLHDIWHNPGKVKLEILEGLLASRIWQLQEKYHITESEED